MKITRLSVFHKTLPLKDPYWLSGGRLRFDVLDATFVKVETDTGLVGWGEGTPWGHTYVPAYGPGIRAGLQIMAPVILGLDPRKPALWNGRWIHAFLGIFMRNRRWIWRAGISRDRRQGSRLRICSADDTLRARGSPRLCRPVRPIT